MKKIFFTALSMICFSMITNAQQTLTSTNFTPSIGDNQLYYVADTNSVIDNTIGANTVFNYSGLQTYGMTQTQHYINSTTTTYSSDFPSATYADSTSGFPINKNYSESISTDSLLNIGLVADIATFGTVVIKYTTNPEILMKFPFNYGNFYIDPYAGVFSVQGATTNGSGNATVMLMLGANYNYPWE